MKDIGDKLRRCPVGVCSTFKTDLAVNSVLGGNFVAIWVSNLYIQRSECNQYLLLYTARCFHGEYDVQSFSEQ